jgi:hypothetical protein
VTAAFWLQLMVAGLIGVLIVVSTVPDSLRVTSASPLLTALALAESAWLTFSAVGLRRGDRVARWMSVAGLTVPPLILVAADTSRTTSDSVNFIGARAGAESALIWHYLSLLVSGVGFAFLVALDLAALTLLMTRGGRRFFVRPVS